MIHTGEEYTLLICIEIHMVKLYIFSCSKLVNLPKIKILEKKVEIFILGLYFGIFILQNGHILCYSKII